MPNVPRWLVGRVDPADVSDWESHWDGVRPGAESVVYYETATIRDETGTGTYAYESPHRTVPIDESPWAGFDWNRSE